MLQGEKVFLRLVEKEDLPLLVRWRNKPQNWKQFFNKFPLCNAQQEGWFSSLINNNSKKLFMICKNNSAEPIGTVGLDNINFTNNNAEYGNMVIGEHGDIGKGYASEATKLLLDFCFSQLGLHRLYLQVLVENQRAIKLYEKQGFKTEGTLREAFFSGGKWRDILTMGLLQREYQGQAK